MYLLTGDTKLVLILILDFTIIYAKHNDIRGSFEKPHPERRPIFVETHDLFLENKKKNSNLSLNFSFLEFLKLYIILNGVDDRL